MTNWVFIRGLAREKRHWKGFPDLVSKELGGEAFCFDLPGVGSKSESPAPLQVSAYAENLHQNLGDLRSQFPSSTKWILVAVSLGGMVGLDWVARYPRDFDGLITINTSAGNLSPLWKRLRPEAIRTILKLFFRSDVSTREKAILELTTNLIQITPELVNQWVQFDKDHPLTRGTFLRQILAATTFRLPHSLPVPALVLAAEKDRLTHPQCSKDLAAALQLPLALHPTAGHDLALDDPHWVLQQLQKFSGGK